MSDEKRTDDQTDLLRQHERALSFLCGLHPCVTIDGPPEEIAERIFDHVQAQDRENKRRIADLNRSLEYFRAKQPKKSDEQ